MPGTMEERVGRLHRDVQGQNRDLLVATVGVAVVGYARLGLVPDGDSGTAPAGWYVLGLMVAPSVRRLGVGEALLRGVVERAAVLGAGELWSFTDVRNAVSADLHRLVGFVEQRRGRIGFPGLPADSEDVLLRLLPIVPVVQRQLDRKLEPARAADAEPLLALREAAAAWLADRGIRQWQPGEASLADVRHQVQAGEWHVVREAEAPAAALRLLWQDEPVWGTSRRGDRAHWGVAVGPSGEDRRLVPAELGRLLTKHHPMPVALALGICSLPGLLFGLGIWLGALRSWIGGVAMFVGMTLLVVALFSEFLFIEQRLHEHGLVLDSFIPGTPRYVLPYAAIDLDSIRPAPRQPIPEADRLNVMKNRKFRQVWGSDSVLFTSITPSEARRLAKGRESWEHLVEGFSRRSDPPLLSGAGQEWAMSLSDSTGEEWAVGFSDNARAAADLADAVAREQGVHG